MLFYCLKCIKKTENKNPRIVKTKNGRITLSSNCAVCEDKKSRFIKERIKTHLSQTPIFGTISFKGNKMNEIINKFLLARDKFMPEMHLKLPGFI